MAPLTGVFYRSSSPDVPAFVETGDRVKPGDVLCILEAMKLFNEIQSDYAGTIVRIVPGQWRAGIARGGALLDRAVMPKEHGRRSFDELLADRRGLLDAPHYRAQVEAIVGALVHGAARRQESVCGAATAAAPPKRSTWPPSFRGAILRERPGLHSEALSVNSSTLTCVGNDYGYDHVFSRQVEAFAHPGDVVIGMTTSGTSRNVVLALEAAKRRGAVTVAFTGNGGGNVAELADLVAVSGPDGYAAIVQEVHQVMAHIVCDLVEQRLIFDGRHSLDADAHGARRTHALRTRRRTGRSSSSAT